MGRRYRRAARLAAAGALTALAATACSSITNSSATLTGLSGPAGTPIRIGISLPLTGQFLADGQASLKGYQLWASDVNVHGGLLGRPVKLVIRNDKSDEKTTVSDYKTLITQDQVNLTLAPFSSLLTVDAAKVTDQHGYVLPAGSAGAPAVYGIKSHLLFSTNVPVQVQLQPVVNWIASMPASQRPATAAYPMVEDPFADPPVQATMAALPALGVRTVYQAQPYTRTSPAALVKDATAVAHSGAQMVVLGSVDVPTVSAFINTFAKLNYNPKVFVAAAGPDQGQAFINAVGASSDGVMVPNGWYGALPVALSHVMVQDYIGKYGGNASAINADVAESYSAGEVLAAGVTGAGTVSNQAAIIRWLHSHQIQTVLGPVKFGTYGENVDALKSALIFQWQPGQRFIQVLPGSAAGSAKLTYPKPAWGG